MDVKILVVAVAVAGLALAGCSSEPAQLTPDVPVVAAPTTTTSAPPVTTTAPAPTTTTAPPTTEAPAAVAQTEAEVVPTAMSDAECDAYAASSPLPNAELFPQMRAIGCGPRLDELEAAATAAAQAQEETYVPPTSTYEIPSCPDGEVFSPLGPDGCMSPEEAARISYLEGLCGGGYGPVDVCGPGRESQGG